MSKDENNPPGNMLTVRDLSWMTGLSERLIERLIALEVIEPAQRTPEPCFPTEVVTHVRRIRHIHVELGVSWSSMPLVLELLERIGQLESRLPPR